MIDCIIVDDQEICREALKDLIEEHFSNLNIVGIANDGKNAIKLINKHNPDVVFLDVEMPGMTGFEMLANFDEVNFEIIFTTAKDKYTLQAIRSSALDYLIKPVLLKEMKNAVDKVAKKSQSHNAQIKLLLKNISSAHEPLKKIALPTLEGFTFLQTDEIIHCNSDNNYTMFYLVSGKSMLVTIQLKEVEDMLSERNFCRIHKSHIINLNQIKKYVRGNGGYVVMNNGNMLSVSRVKKDEFLKMVGTT